jgi:parallel beta-helix repeat protein
VVPDDYLTIQEAINNADIGDKVFVRNGTYSESIIVDKVVSLLGENRETTIINASGFHDGIIVRSDNVTVEGFTVLESGWNGICVEGSGCSIIGNNLIGNHEAIFLDGRAAIVRNNTVCSSYIADNGDCGILIWNSQSNNITSNVVQNNCFGIYLYIDASMNIIEHNQVLSNEGSGIPIVLDSSDNTISNNNISGNGFGCDVWTCGIAIAISSNRNTITFNAICDNRLGIRQHYHSDNNRIHHNNFINNMEQIINYLPREPCINIWDNEYSSGGNYWSNYNGTDSCSGSGQNITGSDGIGDSSYVIDDYNVDRYPLMSPLVFEDNFIITPEFPSLLILPLFMIATLLAGIAIRRRQHK